MIYPYKSAESRFFVIIHHLLVYKKDISRGNAEKNKNQSRAKTQRRKERVSKYYEAGGEVRAILLFSVFSS